MLTSQDSDNFIANSIKEKDFYIKAIRDQGFIGNKGWPNDKSGGFIDFNNDALYRFRETDDNCSSYLISIQCQKKSPIIAGGIIAWIIKHWGANTKKIFSVYYGIRLEQYKNKCSKEANVLNRNLEHEFKEQHLRYEKKLIAKSKSKYCYMTKDEKSQIKSYIRHYFDYIENHIDGLTKESTDKPSKDKKIDEEELGLFFKPTFKGYGNGAIDYFRTLVEELEKKRTNKEFAQIALLIHKSTHMNDRKPRSFEMWYKIFCECVGCEKKTYKPRDLTPPSNIKTLFNYL